MNAVLERARALAPELKRIKDDIHRHPELSFQEVRTTKIIKDQLLSMGSTSLIWGWRPARSPSSLGRRRGPP